jgi:hypothetical protein
MVYTAERRGDQRGKNIPRETVPYRERVTATIACTLAATGIGRTTLYREIKDGHITITKFGTRTLVFVDSVLGVLEARRGSPAPAPVAATAASLASSRRNRRSRYSKSQFGASPYARDADAR